MRATEPRRRTTPQDRSVRRTWWFLSASFLVLAAITAARAITSPDSLAWALAIAVALAALAAIAHRNAVVDLEVRGRAEAENFARILRGLSRSVSVDAIVGAIVDDLGDGTGADHVVVVRRRPEGGALEATLVTRRAGVPNSSTVLPLGDLEVGAASQPSLVPVPMTASVSIASAAAAATSVGREGVVLHPHPYAGSRPREAAARSAPGMRDRGPAGAIAGIERRAFGPERRAGASGPFADRASRIASWCGELLQDFGLRPRGPERTVNRASRAEVLGTGSASQAAARIAERVRSVYGLSHTLAAPLQTEDGVIGAIVVSRRDRLAWDVPARRLLEGAAVEASAALARAYSFREATANASTDPLTGLPNRRYFDEFCGLLARRRRAGDAVAVLMIDIDKFKVLNDTFGHPVGDLVLQAVATAIVSAVREEDVPARVGGEEFAVLLRNPGPEVALEVGGRVCEAVRALDLSIHGIKGVSVSVGVANAQEADEPIPEIIERADQALLRAKRAGRDRVLAG